MRNFGTFGSIGARVNERSARLQTSRGASCETTTLGKGESKREVSLGGGCGGERLEEI